MKATIAIIVFSIFLMVLSSAQTVKIGVKMDIVGNISALFYHSSNGVLKIEPEFYNTGSVVYKAKARLDVMNGSTIIFTGWSKEENLMPGERKSFELFFYTPETLENVTARIRIYYGYEIAERKINLRIENNRTVEDVFQIKNFRTYDNDLRFQIRSSKPMKSILIIPKDYTIGWVFGQKRIENPEANRNIEVDLPYEAPVLLPQNITIEVVSEDGSYYYSNSYALQKESGILKYFHYLTDWLSLVLNI